MEDNLPYRAEYAKSNRSLCKGCKKTIPQDTLRLAVMVQSAFHDGKNPNWFHWNCFFDKQRPKSVGDIAHFEQIRYEDQKKVEDKIKTMSSIVVATGKGKGKKRANNSDALKDYGIEYAKSGRAACRGCEQKISQGEIRVKKVSYETEVGMKYGGQALWHHVECFAQVRNELGYLESGDILPGFKSLKKDDQDNVKKIIPAIKSEEVPIKKMKIEDSEIKDDKFEKNLMKQTKSLFKYRDYMKENLKKPELITMLKDNKQEIPEGNDEMLDRISDMLLFGQLIKCEKCKGQFVFNKSGYICTGNLTEWVKCHNLVKEPKRKSCVIPKVILADHDFFKSYKCVVSDRIFKYTPPTAAAVPIKKEEPIEGPRVHREKPPLYNMEFVIIGTLEKTKDDIKKVVQKLGGKISTKIHEKTAAIISNENEVEKFGAKMAEAKDMKIQVVPIDFLSIVEGGGAISYINSKSICDWGSDPNLRIIQEDEKKSNKSKSIYTKSVPSKITLKLKGGIAVDPDSELEDLAHVLVVEKDIYNVVLSLADLQSGKNSYYKMQVLASDKNNKFWVFRSWGRIGTTIGSNKLEKFSRKSEAIESFETQYEDKTGNSWRRRDKFEKYPGKYIPIDIDYEENIPKKMNEHSSIKSKLELQVQNLIKLLFDVDNMKKAMLEFELDTEKMPLGKLSSKQVQKAYSVLTELSNLITNGGDNSKFTDASNRFYSLIPHNFGINQPPLLDTSEIIKMKIDMLESLLEIEIAYNMLKDEDEENDKKNPIDTHYDQLKTDMKPILRDSDEFKLLEQYVQNTHAETHSNYKLIIEDIFEVARKGEDKRYKPFKKLHNRKLLWHGSRLTNFAGILSHGLKIAPPEAPVTGYMFGKGIYFADMVSKSANYCFTSVNNATGLLLLCEVALGDMLECKEAKYVTKLPKDKHSTKGIGQFQPKENESIIQKDGVEIPLGKAVKKNIKSSLLYNEFIVYDVAQVNVKYLFKMRFDYDI